MVKTDFNQVLSELIAETKGEGIWIIGPDAKTEYVSDFVSNLLGYKNDELVGHGIYEFMDDEAIRIAQLNVERRKQGIKERHDFRFIHKNGNSVWVAMRTSPIQDENGEYKGALAIVSKREPLTHSEWTTWNRDKEIVEKTDAIEMRDKFISITSHELRNPLTALRLQLDLIHRVGDEKVHKFAEKANTQIESLERLIDDLLDSTRASAGKLSVHKEPVDLAALVRDIVLDYPSPVGCPVRLHTNKPVIEGEWDGQRIRQVVTNLLNNATKYACVAPIDVSVSDSGEVVDIRVKDYGAGIPSEKQEEIFGRFNQLETRNNTGLGLGLYLSKEIVEAQGGEIKLCSEVGKGSEFIIHLPKE